MRYYLVIIVFVLLMASSCKKNTSGDKGMAVNLAATVHRCTVVTILKSGKRWVVLDVCGTQRYYEYGSWCDKCDASWRERAPGR